MTQPEELSEYGEPHEIGQDLFYGIGRRKNYRKAFPYLLKAAEAGHVHCIHLVGYSYNQGLGVEKDLAAALSWYEQAAERNHAIALCNLAIIYEQGQGVVPDLEKAVGLYIRSAELGDLWAAGNLGLMYLEGSGTERNLPEGIRWIRLAAHKGEAKAQYNLGEAYRYGSGVTRNRRQALHWFHKAVAQGHRLAAEAIIEFQSTHSNATLDANAAASLLRPGFTSGMSRQTEGLCAFEGRVPEIPAPAFPTEDVAPAALLQLERNCGPLAAWWVLRYFKKWIPSDRLIQACRHTRRQGTSTIALALALREYGLSVTFYSQPTPAPNRNERRYYALAEGAGVVIAGAAELDEVLGQICVGSIPIFMYNTDDDNGHFSPAVGVEGNYVILPYAAEAQMLMNKVELLCRWSAPGIYRQCIVVSRTM